jgi:chromosome segregation ATPase
VNFKIEESRKRIQFEIELIKENFQELQKKYEKSTNELEKSNIKIDELEKQLNYNITENQDICQKLSTIESENEKMKLIIEDIKSENQDLKYNGDISHERLSELQNSIQEMKITLHSSFSIAKVFIHKFVTIINEDLTHNYSKSFCDLIDKLSRINSFLPSEINSLEIIKNLEDFSRNMGTELEVYSFLLYR